MHANHTAALILTLTPRTPATTAHTIAANVERAEAAAEAIVEVALTIYTRQIAALAAAAEKELAFLQRQDAEVAARTLRDWEPGESFWDIATIEDPCRDVLRFAAEARLWAAYHAHLTERIAAGLPAFTYRDTALEEPYTAVERERHAMEAYYDRSCVNPITGRRPAGGSPCNS